MSDPDLDLVNLLRPDARMLGVFNLLEQQHRRQQELIRQFITLKLKEEGMSDFDVEMWFMDRERERREGKR